MSTPALATRCWLTANSWNFRSVSSVNALRTSFSCSFVSSTPASCSGCTPPVTPRSPPASAETRPTVAWLASRDPSLIALAAPLSSGIFSIADATNSPTTGMIAVMIAAFSARSRTASALSSSLFARAWLRSLRPSDPTLPPSLPSSGRFRWRNFFASASISFSTFSSSFWNFATFCRASRSLRVTLTLTSPMRRLQLFQDRLRLAHLAQLEGCLLLVGGLSGGSELARDIHLQRGLDHRDVQFVDLQQHALRLPPPSYSPPR